MIDKILKLIDKNINEYQENIDALETEESKEINLARKRKISMQDALIRLKSEIMELK